MSMDLKIFVIMHKKCNIPDIKCYIPMMVGPSNYNGSEDTYYRDNKGDNISEKNDSYCELTGLYWMWKHELAEYIGLVHYRRYFVSMKNCLTYRGRYIAFNKKNLYSILSENECECLLEKCDIIVKENERRKMTNKSIFIRLLGESFWNQISSLINMEFHDYYEEFEKVAGGHTHLNCNMFIGKRDVVNDYCEWLFAVLDRMDTLRIQDTGDRYHNRELGYLGELLFEVWLKRNDICYKVVPVVNIDDKQAVNGVMNIPEFVEFYIKMVKKHLFKM